MVTVDPDKFLEEAALIPVIDVRSPIEFDQGHIPGAINIPLFTDEERVVVGTLYKNSGREASVLAGLDMVGPKLAVFVKEARKVAINKKILVHCWRGGLRSKNMTWLFETSGLHPTLLEGGYKAYRGFIRKQLELYINIIVLGGKTGSGKSDILHELKKQGEQVLDLEGIANHKGSAFGHIGQEEQPSNEQFENDLYYELAQMSLDSPIWTEDESRGIGRVGIPDPLFHIIRTNPVVFIEVPIETRVKRLVKEYAHFDKDQLISAVERIAKKLGGQHVNEAIESIQSDSFDLATEILLVYYDKAYLKGLFVRDASSIHKIEFQHESTEEIAKSLIRYTNEKNFSQENSISI